MKTLKLSIIALAAAVLIGCGFGGATDEPVTAAPAPVPTPTTATAPVPTPTTATTPTAVTVTTPTTPVPEKPQDNVQTFSAHIDASAFLNALVESGCQINHAEYKEVKRGGAIKVVCSKTVDALNVELDDL